MLEQDRIIKINIEEEMKSSYIDYSMSVIVSRALPDVRDGFKPVHRRILFGMMGLGNTSDKPYKKSARVGITVGSSNESSKLVCMSTVSLSRSCIISSPIFCKRHSV